MRILTAEVIEGQLEVPEGTLRDGDIVTLLVPEPEEKGFRLSEEQRKEILRAIDRPSAAALVAQARKRAAESGAANLSLEEIVEEVSKARRGE